MRKDRRVKRPTSGNIRLPTTVLEQLDNLSTLMGLPKSGCVLLMFRILNSARRDNRLDRNLLPFLALPAPGEEDDRSTGTTHLPISDETWQHIVDFADFVRAAGLHDVFVIALRLLEHMIAEKQLDPTLIDTIGYGQS